MSVKKIVPPCEKNTDGKFLNYVKARENTWLSTSLRNMRQREELDKQ
jgi:hypothetical protein